jgi:hypothetical protein
MTKRTIAGVEVEKIQTELERIDEEKGGLHAKDVVNESRPEGAVLHPAFEWDDAVAGEAHRVHQARSLIRQVTVVCNDAKGDPVEIQAWTHVPRTETSDPVYTPTVRLIGQPDQFDLALREFFSKIADLEHSVALLLRIAPVSEKTRNTAKMTKIRDAIQNIREISEGE